MGRYGRQGRQGSRAGTPEVDDVRDHHKERSGGVAAKRVRGARLLHSEPMVDLVARQVAPVCALLAVLRAVHLVAVLHDLRSIRLVHLEDVAQQLEEVEHGADAAAHDLDVEVAHVVEDQPGVVCDHHHVGGAALVLDEAARAHLRVRRGLLRKVGAALAVLHAPMRRGVGAAVVLVDHGPLRLARSSVRAQRIVAGRCTAVDPRQAHTRQQHRLSSTIDAHTEVHLPDRGARSDLLRARIGRWRRGCGYEPLRAVGHAFRGGPCQAWGAARGD